MAITDVPTIKCYTGDTTSFPVEITENGTAMNITGHTLSWLISSTRDSDKLLQIDVTSHSAPTEGKSTLIITAANLVTIGGAGDYWITCVDVDALGKEITRVVANLLVLARVARS